MVKNRRYSCSCSGKPPIFILDEPTSSMDAKTEKKFIENFKEYNPDATLLLITHRTSLLTLVDKVIVIDQGKIVGSGSVDGFLKATKSSKRTSKNQDTADNSSLTDPVAS